MEAYPEKYDRLLKEGEKMLWHKKGDAPLSKALFFIILAVFAGFVVLFIAGAVLSQNTSLIMPGVFFIFLCFGLNFYYVSLNNIHYLVTNQRIIRDTKPNSKFNIFDTFYKEIHEISMNDSFGKNVIAYYTMPRSFTGQNGNRAVLFFPEMDDDREILQLLQENWMPLSPYQIFVDKFQVIAQKHNLELEGFHPFAAKNITIKGEIDNMPFLLSLSELYDIQTMSISITCPNPENNYLSIRREKSTDSIGKLMGTQDLKVNNTEFDDKFLLQSDNQHFFEKILDNKIQETILTATKLLDWQISLGTKPHKEKNKRSYKKGDDDILDAHLTIENPRITKRDESNTTALIYQCDNLIKHSSNLKSIAEHCIINTEMMIELARKIKAYND